MPEIVLIRHAESQANVDGVWNGQIDGPLSAGGEATLGALGNRLRDRHFDKVISSPLERARRTADAFADEYTAADEFIELDIGGWEGMSREQVLAEAGDQLREAVFSRDIPMGGKGESLNDLQLRAEAAVDELAASLGDDGVAAVVTHGGFIQEILRRHLSGRGRRIHTFAGNTSLTRLVWAWGRPRLAVFNDMGHLGPRPGEIQTHLEKGEPVIALVRHGRTRANIEGRWQGQGDWGLDELGHRQAAALADWYGTSGTVYASPLGRAQSTARYMGGDNVVTVDGLKEIAMGLWEGLTSDEIFETWPDQMRTIYEDGVDLKRGETGESWGELTRRFRATVDSVTPAADGPTLVVAHGGAIRAYVSSLTETSDTHSESLHTPVNTSVTHVAMTSSGPLLLDFGVAAHLEKLS